MRNTSVGFGMLVLAAAIVPGCTALTLARLVDTLTPDALGVKIDNRVVVKSFEEPAQKKAGQKVADVAALVDKLKNEAKAI